MVEKMDSFACSSLDKVTGKSDSIRKNWFQDRQHSFDSLLNDLTLDDDLLMEQILENMNTTPIGKVLKKIATLPEVSRQKVLKVRREITEGNYDLNERLDLALEKVLDDLKV
jgi:hypothetical protein